MQFQRPLPERERRWQWAIEMREQITPARCLELKLRPERAGAKGDEHQIMPLAEIFLQRPIKLMCRRKMDEAIAEIVS